MYCVTTYPLSEQEKLLSLSLSADSIRHYKIHCCLQLIVSHILLGFLVSCNICRIIRLLTRLLLFMLLELK